MNSLKFAKSIFSWFLAISVFIGFNSCKQLVNEIISPSLPGVSTGSEKTILSPTNLVASNGLKQKISLSWDAVLGASHYYIYHSDNPTTDFTLVGETDKNFYDDAVSAGKTAYYKVRAVRADGTSSDFTNIVKGTSLAVPIVSKCEVVEDNITIYWYMANARDIKTGADNYEKDLHFLITCEKQDGSEISKTVHATDFIKTDSETGEEYSTEYFCEFIGLGGNVTCKYTISAFTTKYQNDEESSPSVTKETMLSYTPKAPTSFSASKGVFSNKITLAIGLPPVVQVRAKNDGKEETFDWPLSFMIERKVGNQSYKTVCEHLFFDGTVYDKKNPNFPKWDVKENVCTNYKEGDIITWEDVYNPEEAESIKRGVEYTYRVTACPDEYFASALDKVSDAKVSGIVSRENPTAVGFVSARPNFKVVDFKKTLSEDESAVESVSFKFKATWNDMGTGEKYKFAIKQKKERFEQDKPAEINIEDWTERFTEEWIGNSSAGYIFSSLEEVEAYSVVIDLKESPETVRGNYKFEFYIIPSSAQTAEEGSEENVPLEYVTANEILYVSDDPKTAIAEIIEVKSGYTNRVPIKFKYEGETVGYKFIRQKLQSDGTPIGDPDEINVLHASLEVNGEEATFVDTTIESGGYYAYTLSANGITSEDVGYVQTLGAPVITKGDIAYSKVTFDFQDLATDLMPVKYTAVLGEKNKFGNAETFVFNKDEIISGGENIGIETNSQTGTITITIENPAGYDDAEIAGTQAVLTIKATSLDENDSKIDENSGTENVKVMGPAGIALVGTDWTNDSSTTYIDHKFIKIQWNKVDDAVAYAIYRTRPEFSGRYKEAKEAATDVYYYVPGETLKCGNITIAYTAAKVKVVGNTYILTDTQTAGSNSLWNQNQSRIEWGLPYEYVVLPLVKGTEVAADDTPQDFKVVYKNLTPVKAFTYGYGLRLLAAKAESNEKISLTWEAPNPAAQDSEYGPTPYIKRRISGTSTDWENLNDTGKGKTSYEVTPGDDDFLVPYEYIIAYENKDPIKNTTSSAAKDELPMSFWDQIKDDKDEYDERSCKGYIFAVDTIEAKTNEDSGNENYYCENVSWNKYDWNSKARGPEKAVVQLGNANKKTYWNDLFELKCGNEEKNNFVYDKTFDSATTTAADIKITGVNTRKYKIKPRWGDSSTDWNSTTETPSTTTGLLQVLRDAKHYYKINATRTNSAGDIITAYVEDAYAYREITDEELIKATTLVLAQALELSNVQTENSISVSGATGGFSWSAPTGSFNYDNDFHWNISDYVHNWTSLPGTSETIISFMKIKDTEGGVRGYKGHKLASMGDTKLVQLSTSSRKTLGDPFLISISGYNVSLSSYTATVNFKQSDSVLYASVQRDGDSSETVVANVSTKEDVRKWSPIRIGGTNTFYGTSSADGWWPAD